MLELQAFGDPNLKTEEGVPLDHIVRQTKRFALLIFLSCDGPVRPHRRDEITALFWPESNHRSGRNALRQALHLLRGAIGSEVIRGNGSDEIHVEGSQLRCDVQAFVENIRDGSPEAALRIYTDDFLPGFHLPGSPGLSTWADRRRTWLKETAARTAEGLAHRAEGRRDSVEALHWWRRALLHRPYDEKLIRRIMALLAWDENRGEAVSEFEEFQYRMITDLGLKPSPGTISLVEKISSNQLEEVIHWVGDRRDPARRSSVPHFRRAEDLESA